MADDHHYATYAIDLDGILLPDVPLARYDEDLAAALLERDALLPLRSASGHRPANGFARSSPAGRKWTARVRRPGSSGMASTICNW